MPSRFACSRNGFKTAAHDGSALLLRGTTLIPRTVTRCALLASSKAATCNGVSRPALLASSGRRLRGQYPRGSPRRLAPAAGSLSGGWAASCSHPRLLLESIIQWRRRGCQGAVYAGAARPPLTNAFPASIMQIVQNRTKRRVRRDRRILGQCAASQGPVRPGP